MNCRHWFCFIVLGFALVASVEGQLRLLAKHEGREIPVLGLENGRIIAMDGNEKIPLPRMTEYRLDGDLAPEASKVNWSPNYSIERNQLSDRTARTDVAAIAQVSIRHLAELDGKKVPSSFLESWPEGTGDGGLVVVLWIVDTKVVRVGVRKFQPTKSAKFFAAMQEFQLTEPELAGRAAVMLLSNGRFLTPAPRFKDTVAQAAFANMMRGDVPALRAALDGGLKATVRGVDGSTLLHFAAEAGMADAINLLLERGAKVNAGGSRGNPPLYWAALNGRYAAVQRLLDAKANPNETLDSGDAPLLGAIKSGHLALAKLLIERGADVNAANDSRESSYSVAIDEGYADLAVMLHARGAKLGGSPSDLSRVVVTQARKGNVAMVRFLLDQRVPLPKSGTMPVPILTEAAISEKAELVPVLLGAGADLNERDADGRTALFAACARGADAFAKALVEAGADVRPRAKDGKTALHFAALGNRPDLVDLLIQKGVDPTIADMANRTALDYALRSNAPQATLRLAALGAVLNLDLPEVGEAMGKAIAMDAVPLLRDALKRGWSANTKFGARSARWVANVSQAAGCLAELEAAGAAPLMPDEPSLAPARELDAPVRVVAARLAVDPRDPDMPFPAALVKIDLLVDPEGRVQFPVVRETPSWTLAAAALQAIETWRFSPPLRHGKPTCVRVSIPLEFASSAESIFGWMMVDVLPVPLKRVPPTYPADLSRSGKEGRVRLAFTVGKDGRVKQPRAINSTNPALVEPAVAAVLQWIFKPGEIDGSPEEVRLTQDIEFHLQ
jgi:TonB family protein